MVAIFSRPSNRGYLPLCYDSKTPLALVPLSFQWFMNRQLHPPSSFTPVCPPSPFCLYPFSRLSFYSSLFFFFPRFSYRQARVEVPWSRVARRRSLDTSYYAWRVPVSPTVSHHPTSSCWSRDDVARSHKSWPAAREPRPCIDVKPVGLFHEESEFQRESLERGGCRDFRNAKIGQLFR